MELVMTDAQAIALSETRRRVAGPATVESFTSTGIIVLRIYTTLYAIMRDGTVIRDVYV